MNARDAATTLAGNGRKANLRFDLRRDLVAIADAEGRFTSLNRTWEDVTGWTREELMAKSVLEFLHPDDVGPTQAVLDRSDQPDFEVEGFPTRIRCRNGSYRWLRWHSRTDGEMWIGVGIDVTEEHEAEERIRRAIAEDRLLVYAQPIFDSKAKEVVLEELLVRLRENGEVLTPARFLPAAELGGAITVLDHWMVGRALALAESGREVAVNLSPRTLAEHDRVAELLELLEASPHATRISFEITETAAIENMPAARELAVRLQELGCGLALDDFGTGTASFIHLRELPISAIKIDRSFIAGLPGGGPDAAVCRAVTLLARELGARTVAEGVETREVLESVTELGIDRVQGFLCGRPAPV